MNIITNNQQDTKKLFEQGLQELSNNHITYAKDYFVKAILQGHRLAVRYYVLLCHEKNKAFARDMILCAEKRA